MHVDVEEKNSCRAKSSYFDKKKLQHFRKQNFWATTKPLIPSHLYNYVDNYVVLSQPDIKILTIIETSVDEGGGGGGGGGHPAEL